ncbi:hypothetical protein TNIN_248211 [Trichonephila inaurata madagascariensis]|uniref:Uncharacterized protein n=1 Tax=Trichonephila inaurata madagascariensis TaxID=2747483 RepID=A0A8X6Y871_9ARAC|nr:hypothetical protein TNIN_248211 [Trichonephila inaurata madagascariensis]
MVIYQSPSYKKKIDQRQSEEEGKQIKKKFQSVRLEGVRNTHHFCSFLREKIASKSLAEVSLSPSSLHPFIHLSLSLLEDGEKDMIPRAKVAC